MARPNQYGFQPLSPEERSAQTQIGVGTALAGAGIGFPLLGALLTGVGVGQTGLKLAQGQELDAADYMNIGAPLGGAAVGQILKRALPALKALKRSNPQAAIKAEQEVAQELQAALTAKATPPKPPKEYDLAGLTAEGGKGWGTQVFPPAGSPRSMQSIIREDMKEGLTQGRTFLGSDAASAAQRHAPAPSPRSQTNYTAHDVDLSGLTGTRTQVNLGKAGIRDTAVYGGDPAGIPSTNIAPARGYAKTTADQLDFPTNVQMRNVVGEQPAPTVVGNLAPSSGEPTVAGRMLPGPGAFTSAYRRNTPVGNLLMPQVRTEGLPQTPKTQVSPSSFVSAKSVKTDPVGQAAPVFRPPLPRNPAQPIPPPAGTGPVGGARPVPKAPTKPADDTDLFGGRYGAVDDTAAYNEIPAGIPDTQVMKTKPAGMPWSQAMRNWYDEIPTGRKLAGIGAGLTGVATGMSAGDDYGFSNASPMSVEPVKAPRKATPADDDIVTKRLKTGGYKLKSGDTVMDLIQTVTGNKKKQKELLSEIAALNPEILKEEAFQAPMMDEPDSPDMIDPSRVRAGESLVLPAGMDTELKTKEKILEARRAANMKKRADAKKKKQAAPAPRAPVEPPPSIDPVENMAAMGDTRYLHDQRLQEQKEFDELGPALGMQHGGMVPKQPNYFWHLERPAPIQGFQFGGSVGPTDTVPAMLTPGEHVIDRPNAEYVRQNPNDMSNLRRLARDIQNGVPSVPPGQYS